MALSKAFLEACYETILWRGKSEYRGYSLKWSAKNKVFQISKKNRILASWFPETDQWEICHNGKNPAETRMTRQCLLLPQELEQLYQQKKTWQAEMQKQREREEQERKAQEEREKQQLHQSFMNDLNEMCMQLRDHEISDEDIEKIVDSLAYKYIDKWYVVGIHPDRYADNYPMYFSFARMDVMSALNEVDDERIQNYLIKTNKKTYTPPSPESIISQLSDQEIIEKTQIIPIRAQREGNLVTITELEDKRFEKLTVGAISFAEKLVRQNIRKFVPKSQLEVYWWEQKGEYFLPAAESKKNSQEPSSFRELILQRESSNKTTARKSKAKPSRIHLEIHFIPGEEKLQFKKYKPQRGVISWSNNL